MNRFVAETELKNYSVVSIVLLLTHIQTWQTRKDMYTSVTTKVTKVASITGKKEQGNDYPSLRISESCCHGY